MSRPDGTPCGRFCLLRRGQVQAAAGAIVVLFAVTRNAVLRLVAVVLATQVARQGDAPAPD